MRSLNSTPGEKRLLSSSRVFYEVCRRVDLSELILFAFDCGCKRESVHYTALNPAKKFTTPNLSLEIAVRLSPLALSRRSRSLFGEGWRLDEIATLPLTELSSQ
jgi:hypothetical protein